MVKVEIGGSTFFCDTLEEAVRIHRLVTGSPASAASVQPSAAEKKVQKRGNGHGSNGHGMEFLKKLQAYVGQELSSDDLAKIAGASNKTGLGPKMRQLRSSLEHDALELDDYVRKHKPDATSPTMWRIIRAAP